MKSYRPGFIPDDPKGFQEGVRREFDSQRQAANRPVEFLELDILHAEPPRLRKGIVVIADGTDWNPGSGAGMYYRNEANSAWVFVG